MQQARVVEGALMDHAFSGHAGVIGRLRRESGSESGVVGRARSRRRARSSGVFLLRAWEAGIWPQLVLSGGPWGERIGPVWNSAFICR